MIKDPIADALLKDLEEAVRSHKEALSLRQTICQIADIQLKPQEGGRDKVEIHYMSEEQERADGRSYRAKVTINEEIFIVHIAAYKIEALRISDLVREAFIKKAYELKEKRNGS